MFYLREKAQMNQLHWNVLFMEEAQINQLRWNVLLTKKGLNKPAALECSIYGEKRPG